MKQMAVLCWIGVTLTLFLSTENSLAVDLEKLVKIVKFIKTKYPIEGQFSLAVNIPVEQDLNKLQKVFENDSFSSVKERISKDEVYHSTNMVVAKFKKLEKYTDHAKARVLDHINPLAEKSNCDFLVFYSYLSPCGKKCTNEDNRNNIIDKINKVISKWNDYAFVFSKVFSQTTDGTPINKAETVEALKQLGNSKIGHNNIFRCYKPQTNDFKCIRCTDNGKLSEECINN